jgi:hypothetical protein
MRSNRSMPPSKVIPEAAYPDVAAAVEWLSKVFGVYPSQWGGQLAGPQQSA